MKIKIVSKAYLPFGYGITLPWGIYVREDGNIPYLIAHEKEHEAQIQREGRYFKWIMKYLWQLLKYGYRDCPYEIDARYEGAINQWKYKNYASME